jgi:hypothetical protein
MQTGDVKHRNMRRIETASGMTFSIRGSAAQIHVGGWLTGLLIRRD